VRRIQDRRLAPDDLARRVAEDLLRGRIPGHDDAVRIEQEHRVVLHPVDDQAQPLLAFAKLLLVAPPLGQVAGDLGITEQLAGSADQGRDHDVGPEARPVLADTPTLVLEAAIAQRATQLLLRPTRRDRCGLVEDREVAADRLVGGVLLDRLRAAVPGGDAALRRQHEDRVVANAFDQVAKDLAAGARRLLSWFGPCHLATILPSSPKDRRGGPARKRLQSSGCQPEAKYR
jgi:hypothetical protein